MTSLAYGMGSQMEQNVFAQNESGDSAQLQTANVTGELTKPEGGNPYGGEKTGDIAISSDGHQTEIKGLVSASPAEGNVYEAWLGDAGGSEYKLSLGQLLRKWNNRCKSTHGQSIYVHYILRNRRATGRCGSQLS